MHRSVLLEQAIESLQVHAGGRYIDATAGEGGHLMKMVEEGGDVLGIDIDPKQIANLQSKVAGNSHIKLAVGNYANIGDIARANDFMPVDGILFDYGLSMEQLSHSGKGLSFRNIEEPLDMKLNDKTEDNAADLVKRLSPSELYDLFAKYSEEFHSEVIAQTIAGTRVHHPIETVGDFNSVIGKAVSYCTLKHDHDLFKIYPRIYQALRIAVNKEFENIEQGLEQSLSILAPAGRIAIITFHSLEDRIVKQFMKKNNLKQLDKKAIKGNQALRFERSAKLRVIITN